MMSDADNTQDFIPPWPRKEPDPNSILPSPVAVRIFAWQRVDATFAMIGGQTVEQAYGDVVKLLDAGRLHPSSAVVTHAPIFYGVAGFDVDGLTLSRRVFSVGAPGKNIHEQLRLVELLAEASTPEQAWTLALEAKRMRDELRARMKEGRER